MKVELVRPAWGQGRYFHMFEGTPPLGLAYLGASLLEAGHEVVALDAIAEGWSNVMPYGPMLARGLANEQVVARLDRDADVIGISVTSTTDWPLVTDLCERIRRARPHTPIVLGGEHPSALPRFCLATSCADVVVMGEGERTLVAWLEALAGGGGRERWREVAGIAFLDDGLYVETPARARVRDLESLPWPAWQLFDVELYQRLRFLGGALWSGRRSLPMLSSRGCPYSCTFCTAPSMWAPLWLSRSPRAVVDEMQHHRDRFAVTDFSFHDLTTVIKRSWAVELCEELIARDLGVTFQLHCGTRLEELDDELIGLLKRAGLGYLVVAPESRSEETRRRVKKRMASDDIERALAATVRARLPLKVQLLSGLPGDRPRDAWSNVPYAMKLAARGVDAIGTAIFAPFPGTELFDELLESGEIVIGDRWLFFGVANTDLAMPLAGTGGMSARMVKLHQLAVFGAFLLTKLVVHPVRSARSIGRALSGRPEACFFEKMLRSIFTMTRRLFVTPFNGPPVTWTPIDYARFTPADLMRKRRMGIGSPRDPGGGRALYRARHDALVAVSP